MSRKKLIESMEAQMLQTIKWYRDMDRLDKSCDVPTNEYTDSILQVELKEKAKAYNELLVNQYNGKARTISSNIWYYESLEINYQAK